jgi:hypothetical protein
MRRALHFLCLFLPLVTMASGEEERAAGKEAWLGLSLSKPDEVVFTQLPALPPGIGFVVSEVATESSAEKAGLRKLDLLWKMEEQMLVNEGQLATLLHLAAPGDVVTLAVFREGKSLELKVTLGEGKAADDDAVLRRLADSVMRREDGPTRIVDLEERKATVVNERGTAELTRLSDGDAVRITDTAGKVIFEGLVRGRPELSAVPEGWRRQVAAMKRGLDHALSATPAPERQPRPRIVLPPAGVR